MRIRWLENRIVVELAQYRDEVLVPEQLAAYEEGAGFAIADHVTGVGVVRIVWRVVWIGHLQVHQAVIATIWDPAFRLVVSGESPLGCLELVPDWLERRDLARRWC